MGDATTQSRVITYEDSSKFVDVYIEGTAILQAPDPQEALEARLAIAN
jgi:orotidine-5'-phosphate decarboxylase